MFSIYPIILKNDIFLKKNFLCDINNNQYDFNDYIEFVKILIQSENNEDFKFYIIYDDYIKNTNNDFMKFFSYEKYQFVPIVINLRNFYNNKLFCIEYQVSEYCTGNCEYSKKLTKNLYSPPFLDIPESCYKNLVIVNSLQDIYNNFIYISQNIKCSADFHFYNFQIYNFKKKY